MRDPHRETAARLFGKRPEDVTPEERSLGKMANHFGCWVHDSLVVEEEFYMKIMFGKYKGHEISDVPEDYCEWMIANSEKTIATYQAELDRRKLVEEASLSMVERIAQAGFRDLAKKLHPDYGGSAEDFRSLQAAKAQLAMILKEVEGAVK